MACSAFESYRGRLAMKRYNGDDAGEALRLAFSQLEKARVLSEDGRRARTAGKIDEAQYRSLQEFYGRHIQRAREKIIHLREEHRRRAEDIHRQVQELAQQQAALAERVSARELNAKRANRL